MSDARRANLIRFYEILDVLERRVGGARTLSVWLGRITKDERLGTLL